MSVCNCHGMIFLDCPNYRKAMNRAPMTEAKGSDVRAQKRKLFGESVEFKELAERCGTYEFEAHGAEILKWMQERVQAAAVEMREWCAKLCEHELRKIVAEQEVLQEIHPLTAGEVYGFSQAATKIRALLPIPTNAYDAALLRARIETAEITLGWDEMQFLNQVAEWKHQLAALTQPAPETK